MSIVDLSGNSMSTSRHHDFGLIKLIAVLSIFQPLETGATQKDITGPMGSGAFATTVAMLPNGNFVVTDPDYSNGSVSNIGAVYVFASDGSLISTLTGSTAGDHVGNGGVTVLTNGNFVVSSWAWNYVSATDSFNNFGAVTWGSAAAGVSGIVSLNNSLVGETGPSAGTYIITPLENGNYVVNSPDWISGAAGGGGAVTWGDGGIGTAGEVSPANSLVSSNPDDQIGSAVTPLRNGNYVVGSPLWNNGSAQGAGAATWCNGAAATADVITAGNSVAGSTTDDRIGSLVVALRNGNYVVSGNWHDASGFAVGSATWGEGLSGTTGLVSETNSLVGSTAGDFVGSSITALTNGNYVVGSSFWNNRTGAATWGNGSSGVVGEVSDSNSLVGTGQVNDTGSVIVALSNGNYVVGSPDWSGGTGTFGGAATWGDGTSGTVGFVSQANSLIGSTSEDAVGSNITALTNGNYVVGSTSWHNGSVRFAGASTWGDGTVGTVGTVSSSNSLVGEFEYDEVGVLVAALTNGNYVVGSPGWGGAAGSSLGAATWCDGTAGLSGVITSDNSLVGSSNGDFIGSLVALSSGDYLVASSAWNKYTGIVTWASGKTGIHGIAAPVGSLTGGAQGDEIGYGGIWPYSNGNYVVVSPFWSSGGIPGAGAITLVRGGGPVSETVNANNSVVGHANGAGMSLVFAYDPGKDRLVVGRPAENIVTILDDDAIFQNGFE